MLGIFVNQASAKNPFVSITLSNGISFELPKNWIVIATNTRTTLEASVVARPPFAISSSLPFAANLYDSNNQTVGMVNVRVYPTMDVYQNKVVELTPSMMGDVNQELRDSLSNGVMLGGGQVTHRYGT